MPYLPYKEPGIVTILLLSSFLLLLNAVRYILDRLLYCGIIGEIMIGIIWGVPVGGYAWLSEGTQEMIQSLGYLGLIAMVFEGGLNTDFALLRKAAFLAISIATVGLLLPIALSFVLIVFPFPTGSRILFPTPLAAFSSGASLCSTSLGTTYAILGASNLRDTPVGVLLIGAAMLDDVVGLVMVNIVTMLGSGRFAVWPISRPIVASFGMMVVTLLITPIILKPIWRSITNYLHPDDSERSLNSFRVRISSLVLTIPHLSFLLLLSALIGFVTIAAFIDASELLAAFLAGIVINLLPHEPSSDGTSSNTVYEIYLRPIVQTILAPFFFASIGFSIPITDMFRGQIVWKGIVYTAIMLLGKGGVSAVIYFEYFRRRWNAKKAKRRTASTRQQVQQDTGNEPRPKPPHAAAILIGLAMIARGEIGFLIASLSQSSHTLSLQSREGPALKFNGEDVFLVIVWAITLCTIIGPLGVGIMIKQLGGHSRQALIIPWLS
ncbi:Cation/H+ exchanger [Xylogone sp. PMI_703]|nr:Cation/H+ exchanger [Xylogone sp. PMI_703]